MDEKEKSTFIKVDKFDTVVTAISVIRRKLNEAKMTLDKINSLKADEDSAVQKWSADLDAVEAKLNSVETKLSQE
ncbi:hypothetical protein JXB27_03580 [Candidatus Woesearchaeota archaeon]|nr:hypothetical protein [Candidatus Woesearchaeota archaeon]